MALGFYVRWPVEDRTGSALARALQQVFAALPGGVAGRRLASILIDAAGAPPASAVGALMARLADRLTMAPDLEVTLSLDPKAANAKALAEYRAAGINRLSLRAGAMDARTEAILRSARGLFPRRAVDLSFGRPGQSVADWQADLDRVLEAGAGHISIEEYEGDEDSRQGAAFYQLALDHLSAAGLAPYEISHFACRGEESGQLLHGATGGDYLGIGPGAVGRITLGRVCHAQGQLEPADAWLRALQTGDANHMEVLSHEQRLSELLLTGLRLRAGVERAWFEPLAGGALETVLDAERLASLLEDGFLKLDRQGLRLSARGWPLCDAVLARLLA